MPRLGVPSSTDSAPRAHATPSGEPAPCRGRRAPHNVDLAALSPRLFSRALKAGKGTKGRRLKPFWVRKCTSGSRVGAAGISGPNENPSRADGCGERRKILCFHMVHSDCRQLGGARDAGSLKLGRRSGALFIVARGRHACPVLAPRARAIPEKLTLFH